MIWFYSMQFLKETIEIIDSVFLMDVKTYVFYFQYGDLPKTYYNTNPVDIRIINITCYTDDEAYFSTVTDQQMLGYTDDNFQTLLEVIKLDSEDKDSFQWNVYIEDSKFLNLYYFEDIILTDEMRGFYFSFKNNLIQNIITNVVPLYIEQSSIHIQDCTFRNTKTRQEGGVLYGKYSVDNLGDYNDYHFFFYNTNLFENNIAVHRGGAIIILYGARIRVENGTTTFKKSRSLDMGGAIAAVSFSSFTVNVAAGVAFSECEALVGGAVYVADNSDMMFNQSTDSIKRRQFDSNRVYIEKATGNSGAAIFVQTSLAFLSDVIFKNHKDTVTIQIDRGTDVSLKNAQIFNNKAPSQGVGVLDCQSCEKVIIDKIEAYDNQALYGGVISLGDISDDIVISNSNFHNNRATLSAGVLITSNLQKNLKISNCQFTSNYAREAGVLRMIESFGQVTIQGSSFKENKAQSIGVLYVVLSNQTLISDTEFSDNEAETDVGVMSLTNQNQTTINKCIFTRNMAFKKGVFQIDTRSNITIKDSSFTYNQAKKSISLGSVTDSNSFIVTNTVFQFNQALTDSFCLSIMQTNNASFDKCSFEGNLAQSGSSNLEASYFSQLLISRSTFKNSISENKLQYTQGKGHFIMIRSDTQAVISDSEFTGGQATEGGAIYIGKYFMLVANISRICYQYSLSRRWIKPHYIRFDTLKQLGKR